MNQSIDKIAHLLLARKAINSLPAHTKLTLDELYSVLEHNHCGTEAAAAILRHCSGSTIRAKSSSSSSSTPKAWNVAPSSGSLHASSSILADVSSGLALRALHTSSTPTPGTGSPKTRLASAANKCSVSSNPKQ